MFRDRRPSGFDPQRYREHVFPVRFLSFSHISGLAMTRLNIIDETGFTWIGLQKENDSLTGNWVWTDHSPVDFLNWAPGIPDYPETARNWTDQVPGALCPSPLRPLTSEQRHVVQEVERSQMNARPTKLRL